MATLRTPNHLNDCHFFYNSTCTKGKECQYRHCLGALENTVVCYKWKHGQCQDTKCKYRHAKIFVKRNEIACHFEKSEKGCQKYHCPFKHVESRESRIERIQNLPLNEVILPLEIRPS